MAKKVKHSDLFENGIFEKDLPAIEAQIEALNLLEEKYKNVLKASAKIDAKNVKSKKAIDEFTKATKESRDAVEGLQVVEKQKIKAQKKIIELTDKELKSKISLQRANKERRDSLKAEIVLNDKLAGTEEKLLAKNTLLRLERNKLNTTTKQGAQRLKEINLALDRNNAIIDKNSDKLKKQKRNVGNYRDALKGVSGALASIGLAMGAGALARNIFGIFSGFEQEGANLASVLGRSRDQIQGLTEDAKRLGKSTAFTAGEVTQLQTEFAKLGFNEKQIIDATEATLDLAAATGTDLREAAAVAGATLGGFGLDAKETQRVVDVMAKSFSTSALDMEKFKESMKTAAPAARAVGLSIEKTTALLGTLANAGISGSKAGNNLKTSLINLNKAGLTLEQGLEKVAASEDKLGEATKLVGKNAAASFLVLAEGTETTKELTEGLENAGGAAEKMAKTQLDTLGGKMKLLTSAWEGFILSLDSGDGILSRVIGTAIELFTELFTLLSGGEKTIKDLEFEQAKSNKTFNRSIEILKDANQPIEVRKRIIDDLNATYGEYLPNLITEQTTTAELIVLQDRYNEGARQRLLLAKGKLVQDAAAAKQAERLQLIVALEMNDISQLSYLNQIKYAEIFKHENHRQAQIRITTSEYEAQEKMLQRLINATADIHGIQKNEGVGSFTKKGGKDKTDTSGGGSTKTTKSAVTEEADLELLAYEAFYEESKEITREHNLWLEQEYDRQLKEYDAWMAEEKDIRKKRLDWEAWQAMLKEDKEKKRAEREKAARIERAKFLEEAATAINDILQKKSNERLKLIDKEIKANEAQQKTLQELAAKGVINADENLAFEKKRAAELALIKQKEIEKAARQELALTAIKTYSGYVQAGEKGTAALARTVTDISLLKNLISTLDFFYEGTENTGTANNSIDSNGGRLAVLHDNERVMTAEQNKLVSGLSNWELANLGADYKNGENSTNAAIVSQRFQSNEAILNKFESLESAVKNIDMPEVNFHYDSIKNAFIKTVESHGKIERTIHKKSKLF